MTKIGKTMIIHNGKRVGVRYSVGPWNPGIDLATIKIRPRTSLRFPADWKSAFSIENKSDSRSDYFEKDCIRILPSHPLYEQVKAAASAD